MKKKELEKEIRKTIEQSFPTFFSEFDIQIRSAGEIPTTDNEHISNLIRLSFIEYDRFPHPTSVSNFFNPVRQLARAFKEKEMVNELNNIFAGRGLLEFNKRSEIPLCLAEQKVFVNTYGRNYDSLQSFRFNQETWYLFELIELVAMARARIFDVFQDIVLKHGIETEALDIHAQEATESAKVLPQLG